MKIKRIHLVFLIVVILVLTFSYYLFTLQPSYVNFYKNDCGKSLSNFDVIFVYITTCSHCRNDLIRIKELNLTEKTYMVDAASPKCRSVIDDFSDYIIYHKNSNSPNLPRGIYTPTKVCIYNNNTFIGEQSKDALKDFYQDCEKAKL